MKFNNETIRVAVREWIEDENKTKEKYGDINDWDTSEVTDMSTLFLDAHEFNSPIGNWDVSNVKSMFGMFREALLFNQDIGKWNTRNVIDMSYMFCEATSFNHNISNWDVSNVKDMNGMFACAQSFNQPIGNWDISNVENIAQMFDDAESFNRPIGNWNVSNITDMCGVFSDAKSFNQDIGKWDVSKVTKMNTMFMNAQSFNQDISNWNVGNVIDVSFMFCDAISFNCDISDWNVKNVKHIEGIFNGAQSFEKSLNSWEKLLGFSLKIRKNVVNVFSNKEFREALDFFKKENNNNCSFNKISLEFNRWSLTQDLYQIGEFKGYKFIKFCDENVKFPVVDCEYEEIISYKEDDLLNFIGDNELNELCLWYNVELSRVNKLLWQEGTPEDIKEEAENEYSEFFEVPRYNPDEFEELDKTITEFECGFVLNNETFLKSINVELNGINYNSLINWEFSGDNVPEATKKAQIEKNFILIANSIKRYILHIALNINKIDTESIPILILKTYQKFIVEEINNNYGNDYEQLIFDVLSSMFFDDSFGTDSIGGVYDLIETNKFNGISEVRFQIFKEFKPGFTISDFLNMFICVCIPLTFNDLTENQKNDVEKEKIGEIEKFKSLVESLKQ